tara:strand:- start:146 stop:436 length:291 start_codon:yes stop_codon:yes gene_type:complete
MCPDGRDGTTNLKNANEYSRPRNGKREKKRQQLNETCCDCLNAIRLVNVTSVRERDAHEPEQTNDAKENTKNAERSILLWLWTSLTLATETIKAVI